MKLKQLCEASGFNSSDGTLMGFPYSNGTSQIVNDSSFNPDIVYSTNLFLNGFGDTSVEVLKPLPTTTKKSVSISGFYALTSLGGVLKTVKDCYDLSLCPNIKTLEGCPEEVGDGIRIQKMDGLTHIGKSIKKAGELAIFKCKNLESLEGLENAEIGSLDIFSCPKITSFKGFPKHVSSIKIGSCPGITSFVGIHKHILHIDSGFGIGEMNIKSGGLGLLLIDGLKFVETYNNDDTLEKVVDIINKYLEQPMSKQRMIDCQNELIDNDLEEYAQL